MPASNFAPYDTILSWVQQSDEVCETFSKIDTQFPTLYVTTLIKTLENNTFFTEEYENE